MGKKSYRPIRAARRRLPLFPGWQEHTAFKPIIFPPKVQDWKMAVAGVRVDASNALRTLTIVADNLKRELDELRQLREAIAEAERAYLDRQQRLRVTPLS
jgi:hypothetical protein